MGPLNANSTYYEGKRGHKSRYNSDHKYRKSQAVRERTPPKYQRYAQEEEQDYNCQQEYSRQYTLEHAYDELVDYSEQYSDEYYAEPPREEFYYCPTSQECCQQCHAVQMQRASQEYFQGKNRSGRRDASRLQERKPGQAPPRRIDSLVPTVFTHNPYSLPSYELPTHREYFAYDDAAQETPKDCILCLRWVNGTCGEKRKNGGDDTPYVCPFAHPDLSEVPPGVCITYWFTGFCRFDRRDSTLEEPEDPSHDFGLHGWSHYKRLDSTAGASDESGNDGEQKKRKKSRNSRQQSVCYACHHARPEGGFYLFPGVSSKTTVLERETAFALYPVWYPKYY